MEILLKHPYFYSFEMKKLLKHPLFFIVFEMKIFLKKNFKSDLNISLQNL